MRSPRRPRFDDGSLAGSDFRDSGRKIKAHKLQQLCSQVHRALEMALLGSLHDPAFEQLELDSVEPGPDPGSLRVRFLLHPGQDPQLIRQCLQEASGLLKSEVAQAIHRKKLPELRFELELPRDT